MIAALRDPHERRAGWFRLMDTPFASHHFKFPDSPSLKQAVTADDGSQWEFTGQIWELMSYASMRWVVRKRGGRWGVYSDQEWALLATTRSWRDAMRCVAERCSVNAGRPA